MTLEATVALLQERRADLVQLGVVSVSLFGSMARGEATASSDVDLAVMLKPRQEGGLAYLARIDDLKKHVAGILGCSVDVIVEPAAHPRLQSEIDRDRVVVF